MNMESTDFVSSQIPSWAPTSHLTDSAINNASSFFSSTSAKDLALMPFRFVAKVDHVLFRTIPEFLIDSAGLRNVTNQAGAALGGLWKGVGGADATESAFETAAGVAASAGHTTMAEQAAANTMTARWMTIFAEGLNVSTLKSYWGMVHYLASRWAITCFLVAIVLNRVNVYGRSRQRIYLTWTKRLALRIIPIMLLFTQIRQLLQAIRCQTSPDFALYRHGDLNKYSLLDWSIEGGVMHRIAGTMLWWSDDQAACSAVGMARPEPGIRAAYGSFSLLWPSFIRLSLSHFVDNLSAALQQVPTVTEVGMTVFEHSLAFAEAETMILHTLKIGLFGSSNSTANSTTPAMNLTQPGTIPASGTLLAISDAASSLNGSHALDKVNVPVEVLLIALLSCCNAFTSHVINVIGKQNKLRLVNTGFWGCCFMASFLWGFFSTSSMVRADEDGDTRPVSGLLHFPTVAIVGFLPHMIILLGIWICFCIYVVALLLTAVSLGTNPNIRQPTSLGERISIAHDNLQAALQVKGISVRWAEDFYTALLRAGFAALTAASEAVFLNEGRAVEMRQFTWLEEERMDEFELSKSNLTEDSHFQIAEAIGLPPSSPGSDERGETWESGYAKERKFSDKNKDGELQPNGTFVYPNPRTDGVGALQRTTRFYLLFIFMRGIMFTITGWIAYGLGAFLDRIGITSRPRWLRKLVGKSLKKIEQKQRKARGYAGMKPLDFWLIGSDGKLALPKNEDMDIEPEMRKRVMIDHEGNVEEVLDEKLYDWWKMGGWFGTKDASGDYVLQQHEDNEDATSVITESVASVSDIGDENAWESESEGRRTPTQQSSTQSWSFSSVSRQRSPTPDISSDNPLDVATLARYLNPPDQESRREARILASHLSSGASGTRIMTRSRYRQELESERARVLLAGRTPIHPIANSATLNIASDDKPRPLTSKEEAEVLEDLLITRRKNKTLQIPQASGSTNFDNNDDDDANRQAGPPCVVCQCQARTVIAWPCRCLCLCEDCRVTLAMNNFGNCVTCRRNVAGFVRLYVP